MEQRNDFDFAIFISRTRNSISSQKRLAVGRRLAHFLHRDHDVDGKQKAR